MGKSTIKICFIILALIFSCNSSFAKKATNLSKKTINLQMEQDLHNCEILLSVDPKKVQSCISNVLEYAKLNKDSTLLSRVYLCLGMSYNNTGDFVSSLEFILRAHEYCSEKNLKLLGNIQVRLSYIYSYVRDFERALECTSYSIDLATKISDSILLASAYNAQGLIYIHLPDIKKAEENFLLALDINRKISCKEGISRNLNNLCLYRSDNPAQRIKMLEEAIAINRKSGKLWALAENYNNLGTQLFYMKKYEQALKILDTANSYAQKAKAAELILDNNRYRANVYGAQGNYKYAYLCMQKLYTEIENKKIVEHIRIYETNLLKNKVEQSENELLLNDKEHALVRTKYIILVLFLFFISTVFIISYFMYRYRQKKKMQIIASNKEITKQKEQILLLDAAKAQEESKHFKTELTTAALFVRSRNEILDSIRNQIRESYSMSEGDRLDKLHQISRTIKQLNSKATEIDVLVDKISDGFVFKLTKKYNNLSTNDKRLASLLYIGMSSKEIAYICQSIPKTVDMARYRLRKKMELDSDKSLIEELQKFN